MQDYIKKLIVRQWCSEGLRTMFAIERGYERDSAIARAKKEDALKDIKDRLEMALIRNQVGIYEYYVIVGYLDEYAFGSHFQDLPCV